VEDWRERTVGFFPAASQDILHSAVCNCNAPKSGRPAQTPQAAARFAFMRSWRALTRAAARSMTTASPLPKYGLPVSRITAPTGVRPRCHAVAVKGGGLGGARSGRIIEDARRGSLRRPGLAASPRPTPDGCSRGIAHRGSRVRGAAQACRVAPSGRQSEKLNNGGEFRVFDRDSQLDDRLVPATSEEGQNTAKQSRREAQQSLHSARDSARCRGSARV